MHPCKNKGLFIHQKEYGTATTKSPSMPKVARISRQSRETAKGQKAPSTTSFISPHNPRT